MSNALKTALGVVGIVIATQAAAQVTLYSREDFRGESFTADRDIQNMDRRGFNDAASSAVVRGGDWQLCEDARFEGRCAVLKPGDYPSLDAMGLGNRVSSIRAVDHYGYNDNRRGYSDNRRGYDDNRRYAASDQYSRRDGEQLFEAPVTSVHAVVGPPEQRCWVERREYNANVPGAIAGAVIGGILGHQIGGGRGQDIATAGGAVAGAAVGSSVGSGYGAGQDVQHCTNVTRDGQPDYWDVTYVFEGREHRVQMTTAPGATILVNRNGEPRV
jgi:uncharacterized protein YcfJ